MAVELQNPLLWALLIGWILTVTLHEFAHGLVAHLGGDYTIRERGGLTLNPLQYVDPFMSLILPALFLMMGGIALPGGATYIRTDLLRNRLWISATYAAGPAMNFLIFLILAVLIHPRFGWINYEVWPDEWTNAQLFASAMAYLQLFSVILNLIPVPGLDGFGMISPWLKYEWRMRLTTPPVSTFVFFAFVMVMVSSREASDRINTLMHFLLDNLLHIDYEHCFGAFYYALRGVRLWA
jgi:Zn-dependent protease